MLPACPRRTVDVNLADVWRLASHFLRGAGKGIKVKRFEDRLAWYLGAAGAVCFPSFRSALYQALTVLDFPPGSEAVVSGYNHFSAPATVIHAGLKPVFADVAPGTFNMDPDSLERNITERTRAIVVMHAFGRPADMARIMEIAAANKLRVIEDCSHSLGAESGGVKTGAFDIGCFSFDVGCGVSAGGGAVTAQDPAFLEELRAAAKKYRRPGRVLALPAALKPMAIRPFVNRYVFTALAFPLIRLAVARGGGFYPFDEHPAVGRPESKAMKGFSDLQALLAIRQLAHLEQNALKRIRNAGVYMDFLSDAEEAKLPDGGGVFTTFPVAATRAREFVRWMVRRGIDARLDYCGACSRLKAFSGFLIDTPTADSLHGRVVYLPVHSELDTTTVAAAAKVARAFFGPVSTFAETPKEPQVEEQTEPESDTITSQQAG